MFATLKRLVHGVPADDGLSYSGVLVRRTKAGAGSLWATDVGDDGAVTRWTPDKAKAVAVLDVHVRLIREHYADRPGGGVIHFEHEDGTQYGPPIGFDVSVSALPLDEPVDLDAPPAWGLAPLDVANRQFPAETRVLIGGAHGLYLTLQRVAPIPGDAVHAVGIGAIARSAAAAVTDQNALVRYRNLRDQHAAARDRVKASLAQAESLAAERSAIIDAAGQDLAPRLLAVDRRVDSLRGADAEVKVLEPLLAEAKEKAEAIVERAVAAARGAVLADILEQREAAQRAILDALPQGDLERLARVLPADIRLSQSPSPAGIVREILAL